MRTFISLTSALVILAGCSEESPTVVNSNPAGTSATGSSAGGKEDCPDCDPAGPDAFTQAKLGVRWYKPGDKWFVAFQFSQRAEAHREEVFLANKRVETPVFLFQYAAVKATKGTFQNQVRDIIEIAVTQADPSALGAAADLFDAERLDRHQRKLHFRMNDLTDALDVTYFSREYPHGRTVRAPSKANFAVGSSLFPVNVPRLLVNAPKVVAPVLSADLQVVANALVPGWRDKSYNRYDFENGDVVFWGTGDLWPFYVENQQGAGLLVNQALAN